MLRSLLLVFLPALGREGPPPILDPASYSSPTGAYTLEVDPSAPDGSGAGRYVLRRGEEPVWQGERPWTFWEATVTDQGFAAGYAYTAGYRDMRVEGEYHAVILSPTGEVVLDEKVKRTQSRMMHSPPDPLGTGVFHHPDLDRVIFRIRDTDSNRASEEWWCFELPSAKELWRKRPKESFDEGSGARFVLDARAVPGTPLTLVESWRFDFSKREFGVHLALLDADLKAVWQEVRAHDCELPDEKEEGRVHRKVRMEGTLLFESRAGHFALAVPASSEKLVYKATRGGDGAWQAREVERSAHAYAPEVAKQPELPKVRLDVVAEVRLDVQGRSDHPIRDIRAFDFTKSGALRIVREDEPRGTFTFVTAAVTGAVESERSVTLTDLPPDVPVSWWAVGEGRWLVTVPSADYKNTEKSWAVDEATGTVEVLEAFECGLIDEVEGLPDGGFVALWTEQATYTMTEILSAHDPDGLTRWGLRSGGKISDQTLLSPDGIAVTSDGKIAVVDPIQKRLRTFRSDGSFERVCDLKNVWEQGARYTSGVTADIDGGVIVHDSSGEPPLVRMHPDGTVRAKLQPTLPDGGAPKQLPYRIKVAPDGRVWTHDDERLLRLDEKGVVDQVLGVEAKPDLLAEPFKGVIDVFARALVQDKATGSVHVFDQGGERLFVCHPHSDEFRGVNSLGHLAATLDRGVIMQGSGVYVFFNSQGEWQEARGLGGALLFSPASGLAYAAAYGGRVNFFGEDFAAPIGWVDRRPDNLWLCDIADHAVGPDGTLAVLTKATNRPSKPRGAALSLYSARGEAKQLIPLEGVTYASNVALGRGRAFVFRYGKGGTLVDLDDGRLLEVEFEGPGEKNAWSYAFAPEGDELLALDVQGLRLLRLALPR